MSPRENLHQLLMEHAPCEWLDRVQDYFSQIVGETQKWKSACESADKEIAWMRAVITELKDEKNK